MQFVELQEPTRDSLNDIMSAINHINLQPQFEDLQISFLPEITSLPYLKEVARHSFADCNLNEIKLQGSQSSKSELLSL